MYEYKTVAELGHMTGMTDRAMSRLALLTCELTTKGQYEFADAKDILVEFDRARRLANGSRKAATTPGKQQWSKLARFILLGQQFGADGLHMLETLCDLHSNEFTKEKYNINYNGEYNALIEAARVAVSRG